jgi:hypothetical protein
MTKRDSQRADTATASTAPASTAPPSRSEAEHDAIRSSNDRDQALERDGIISAHNRGYDAAVRGDTVSRGAGDGTEGVRRDDVNRNGLEDNIEPPAIDVSAGRRQLIDRARSNRGTDPVLSGGDIDARWEDAESGGDETVGGSTATPGQNDVDEIGRALGVTYAGTEELRAGDKESARDEKRWELDPASSEDYADRTKGNDSR